MTRAVGGWSLAAAVIKVALDRNSQKALRGYRIGESHHRAPGLGVFHVFAFPQSDDWFSNEDWYAR
jgi:hypothetical protein